MNKLFDNFKYLLLSSNQNDLYNQLKLMSHTLDTLHYSILLINQILTSNKSSINRDNLFSNMVNDLSTQFSPIIFGMERQKNRLISSSTSCSLIPTIYSQQIDAIMMNKYKVLNVFVFLKNRN